LLLRCAPDDELACVNAFSRARHRGACSFRISSIAVPQPASITRCLTRRDAVCAALAVVSGPLLACATADGPTDVPLAATPDDAVRRTGDRLEIDIARVPAWGAATTEPTAVVFLQARVIVVRRDTATFTALSAECPHAGCGVSIVDRRRLLCPCHGSAFDFGGARLEGPAPSGLRQFTATVSPTSGRLLIQLD
jgi:Rieske Fe-S protein